MSEQNKQASKPSGDTVKPSGDTVKLINKTSGIRRVLNQRIMPDDEGLVISKADFEKLKKGKAFQAQLKDGEFEVK